MKRYLLVLVLLIFSCRAFAQELQCVVTVNLQNLSEEERKNWDTFKQDVEAYLNAYSWTTNFSGDKIQATINFNILSTGAQVFIQSKRPLYKANQSTVMARFLDEKISFGYIRGQVLEHSMSYRPLESILDYYAYIIIGLDFDSYESNSGSAPFGQAQQIALGANAQPQATGWGRIITSAGAFSRYGYIEDLMDASTRSTREIAWMYNYKVLDNISTKEDEARTNLGIVIDTLIKMKRSSSQIDRSVYYKTFFEAKYTEFADFAKWFKDNKALYFQKLEYLDPAHQNFYEEAKAKLGD
ncbi:MAG: DUF4835 family protein [Ignavibacteriota bacterium]